MKWFIIRFLEPFPDVRSKDIGIPCKNDEDFAGPFHPPGFEIWYLDSSGKGQMIAKELCPSWGYKFTTDGRS